MTAYYGPSLLWAGPDIASEVTLPVTSAGAYHAITGTVGVTALRSLPAGAFVILRFAGAAVLTHNATSFILQGGANYTTGAGDVFGFISEGSGNWREIFRGSATGAGTVAGTGVSTRIAFWSGGQTLSSSNDLRYDAGILTYVMSGANQINLVNGQTILLVAASQTVGNPTITIPNFAGVSDTFAFITLAQTLSNKTLSAPTLTGTVAGTPTFSGATITITNTIVAGVFAALTGPASTGRIRLARADEFRWRNDAGTADSGGFFVDASNNFHIRNLVSGGNIAFDLTGAGLVSGVVIGTGWSFTGSPTISGAMTHSGAVTFSAKPLITVGVTVEGHENVPIATAAPTTPVNGDWWFSDITATRRINVRIGGVTYSTTLT